MHFAFIFLDSDHVFWLGALKGSICPPSYLGQLACHDLDDLREGFP